MAGCEPWKRRQSDGGCLGAQAELPNRRGERIAGDPPTLSWSLAGLSRRDAFRTLLALMKPPGGGSRPRPGQGNDVSLAAWSEELRDIEARSKRLLADDDRDATDIPGYELLADRHAALVLALGSIQAQERCGLLAKARAVAVKDARAGYDGAISIAISLAADVVAVLGQEGGAERKSWIIGQGK